MHYSVIVVSQHAKNVWVIKLRVIHDLFLDLSLVRGLDVGSRAQNLQHNLLTALIPVLSEVDFSVGALIDFLSDLVSLVNHDCLALGGAWAERYLFLALVDLHGRRLNWRISHDGHLLRLRFDHLHFEGFDQVDRRKWVIPSRSRGWFEQHLLV